MESPTFELTKILEWVQVNDYKRIALQFPQDLLSIAPEILLELEKCANDKQFFILADTSYRSCCLDLIAAEHANCDSIVHFGGACMTDLNGKIPSLYIFENTNIDFDNFGENISTFINTKDEKEFEQILILCDSDYSDLENEIYKNVKSVFSMENIHLCRLLKDSFRHEENCRIILKREIPSNFCENKNNLLIFFGEKESPLLPLFVLTLKGINKILHYEPKEKNFYLESSKTNKLLMKRMYLAEKVKDANTIGLVLGYVSMECRKEAISRVRKLCKQRGKKLYVFYIGKLNEAKLTNFWCRN
uniref:2-(3-amino-3-carboxypropyl)histidine synthase subunit 2 n=1 Tax=Meloidogyne incognita TaxID=6306 RepID=A0A914MRZ2_MELIC